jgi:hypothetical protein
MPRTHAGESRNGRRIVAATLAALGVSFLIAQDLVLDARGREPRYVETIDWKKDHFSRIFAASRSELGLSGTKVPVKRQTIADRSCVVGSLIAFDVDDRYAFDVDEPVELSVTYAPEFSTTPFAITWDRNGGEGFGVSPDITPEPGEKFRTITVPLDRARLAGNGIVKADAAVAARNNGSIAVCDVAVTRTNRTPPPAAGARFRLEVVDTAGERIAARVGLYDATGRTPLPSDSSIEIQRYADDVRLFWLNQRSYWPSANRQAFYVDGTYEATVPAGEYELVVAHGPEYRVFKQQVTVSAAGGSTVRATLQRFEDLPAQGWYSADSHVHLMRDRADDGGVWGQLAAEDVHLGNLLEMGNILGTYYKQPAWGAASRSERAGYAVVAGQEDPRTGMRGHTIHWNLKQHVHLTPDLFFNYHKVFEATRQQGSLTGYAHHGNSFNGRRGLALDVPFGLIDFIEVLQGGRINTDVWYSFLNLGYRVGPVGGADYPYFGPTLPGIERTYVKVDGQFSPDAWYQGYRRGQAFVTNGPLVEFSINGQEMGSEITIARGQPLKITASAALNPDVDSLDRLEVVALGDVLATEAANGKDRVTLEKTVPASRSMWIAVRAYGKQQGAQFTTIAHTTPIYVVIDDEPTWNRSLVGELVAYQRAKLNELLTIPVDPDSDLEAWETGDTLVEQWSKQLPGLRPRIEEADRRYQKLLDRARQSTQP